MKNIDELIKNSETEKNIEVRPELWRKLERRLDDAPESSVQKSIWRPWLIAASVSLIFGFSILWKASNNYQVEDLHADITPTFSKEEVVLVNYANYPPADYNG